MTETERPPSGLDPRISHREVSLEAEVVRVEKMRHLATVEGFTFESDEPPELGGDDRHPHPLHYVAAAVGF